MSGFLAHGLRRGILPWVFAAAAGCADEPYEAEPTSELSEPVVIGGCQCATGALCTDLTYSDIPANGIYYLTTFGGGTDTQPMSCGGTADATWHYAAGRARFGCGAKLLVEEGGASCVVEVADCGPNRCVEEAACNCSCTGHFPVVDVSPLVAQYLFGVSSAGWSERRPVTVTVLEDASTSGCPGVPIAGGTGGTSSSGGSGGAGGSLGVGGTTGSGGTTGVGGALGNAGTGGVSGSTGSGGTTPTGGTAGIGGGSGSSGSSGAGGEASTGGSSGGCTTAPDCSGCGECLTRCTCETDDSIGCLDVCSSAGGSGVGGAGASSPTAGTTGTPAGPTTYPEIGGGPCGCRVAGVPSRSALGMLLFGLIPLIGARRRYSSSHSPRASQSSSLFR